MQPPRPDHLREPTRPARDGHAGVPVQESVRVRLGPDERRELQRLASRLLAGEPGLRGHPYGPRVQTGLVEAPGLLLGDHSGLALREAHGAPPMEYRMLALASEGDLLPLSAPPCPAFEEYIREVLEIGPAEVHPLAPGPDPLWRRCLADPALLEKARTTASRHRRFNVVPYMGIAGAWRLAGAVAAASGARVAVAAPPPTLTERVNDKLWFRRRVAEVLGPAAAPVTGEAHGPAALAARVAWFARRFDRVCLKLPNSAASEGNALLEAGPLRRLPLADLRSQLLELMDSRGWGRRFPLLVGVWEAPVLASPSVQLWIPASGQEPLVEGIFQQILEGPAGRFVGVAPSELDREVLQRIAREGALLGALFQELGYFGRCSFDALLVGSRPERPDLLWIECNGRWGGTSLPMTLATRLAVGGRPPFVALDRACPARPGFSRAMEEMGHRLLRPGAKEGVAFLTPTRLDAGRGFDLFAVAPTPARAGELAGSAADLLTAVIPAAPAASR